MVWRLDDQWTGPPSQIMTLEMERDFQMSRYCGGASTGTVLAHWGPQLESHREVSFDGSSGNLTNEFMGWESRLVNNIPRSGQDLRYFSV